MRDPSLEHKMQEIQELMRIWMHFYRILAAGFSPEMITPERESEFLQIKTTVAERHEDFMQIIEGIKKQEDLYIGQNILSLVKRTISLREFSKLSPVEINKISIEWHDANILLNESLGTLEHRRDELAKVSQFQYNKAKWKKNLKKGFSDFVTNPTVRVIFVLSVLGVIGVIIFLNWAAIEQSSIYQNYLSKVIGPILKLLPKR